MRSADDRDHGNETRLRTPAHRHFTQDNQTVVQGTVRFEQAMLKTDGNTAIDREILARLPEFGAIRMITVSGYADRTGSPPITNSSPKGGRMQ